MTIITKNLVGLLFNGATQALASASWKTKVNAVYGFNAAGNGYQVFKPTSQFNSLTELVQNGSYILDAAVLGFDLPGAMLTAGVAPGPGPMSLAGFRLSSNSAGLFPEFLLNTTDNTARNFISRIANATGFITDTEDVSGFGNWDGDDSIAGKLSPGSYSISFYDGLGNVLMHNFVVPA